MATQTHEFKAKTVDEAIEEGLRTLGLGRGEVEIEILQKGSRGIFGLGSEPAIVRLTPRTAAAPPAPAEVAPAVVDAPPTPSAAPDTPPAAPAPTTTSAPSVETPAPPPTPAAPVTHAEPATTSLAPATTTASEEELDQELLEMATYLLGEMVRLMGFTAEVQASWQEEDEAVDDHDEDEEEGHVRSGRYLLLDIEGVELGALIGRRGETLENIQYLLRLMVNQK
ncbi:MAG: Jag N-terminal domain-containing protein, partial [Caldilineaceae bacterium]|nr:Jag N-terminal domain-containing protein [Caldilineaceae bacterium]